MREVLSGNEAAAHAVKLARVDCIPNYPVTPQTEIIETIAKWACNGEFDTDFFPVDSEHSVMSAAVGCSATGVRTFTATSSQGLLLMHEVLYIASGMRLPIVMTNVSRGLSAPITLWPDHNGFLDLRDCGWIMMHAKNNQEVFDSLLQAFRIAEDPEVLLPVMVNMDGYFLSYTSEPVDLPSQKQVDKFLPPYKPEHAYLNTKKPMVQGPAVLDPKDYTYFRTQQHRASLNALSKAEEVFREFEKIFGRSYGLLESHGTKDADYVIVMQGSSSTTAQDAVNEMRKAGEKAGILRLRFIRPLPRNQIKEELEGKKAVAVLDQNLGIGSGGIMCPEIKSVLYESRDRPVVSNWIAGLGGLPLSRDHFYHIFRCLKEDAADGKGRREFILE